MQLPPFRSVLWARFHYAGDEGHLRAHAFYMDELWLLYTGGKFRFLVDVEPHTFWPNEVVVYGRRSILDIFIIGELEEHESEGWAYV